MSIHRRIQVFQVAVILAAATMALTAFVAIRSGAGSLGRVQWAHEQLGAMTGLAVNLNRFSEQIAEYLLLGETERPDLDSARSQVLASFARLRELTIRESENLTDEAERAEEQGEIARLDRMRSQFRAIDRAVERLLLMQREGRRDEALELFRTEVEDQLDVELEQLIAAGLVDERAEVSREETQAARLATQLGLVTLGVLALLVGVTAAAGFVFARSVGPPIAEITAGTQAIERGDLGFRIAYAGKDEFGLLAQRFNAMAAELQRQQGLLLGARAHLEREVAERTQELAVANRSLYELDQQRVRLLADVSHELRTPLTALRGEAEVALRGAGKSERIYRAALETIAGTTAEMGRLVDDLLFLARSDAKDIRFDLRPDELTVLLGDALRAVSRQAQAKSVTLVGPPLAERYAVLADRQRLKQAFVIVLDNAIKYSAPAQAVEVRVGDPGEGLVVEIVDRGSGIAPDEIGRVFDRFYRGRAATERGVTGSGLGLPIARWIVGKHGGSMSLSSRPGEGTAVSILLPRVKAAA